jgi:PTS system nitrogen regulatory IIA component
MMDIAAYISFEDVILDLDVPNKVRLFHCVDEHMCANCSVTKEHVALHLENRERVGSTGLGHGFAIPHARVSALQKARIGYFRLKPPIRFEAPDQQPVTDVFVPLVPEQAKEEHLQILATLCCYVGDQQFPTRLHDCNSPREVAMLLGSWSY